MQDSILAAIGFTQGTSSLQSALVISEYTGILEAKSIKKQMFRATLDAQKAFDVVNHEVLLRNIFFDGITGPDKHLLESMYSEMSSCVKWKGLHSRVFNLQQGVRQGGILSTGHYKRYNNPLLLQLEDQHTGVQIGNINIPHTTCAHDVALLSHLRKEMSSILKTVEDYSNKYRYTKGYIWTTYVIPRLLLWPWNIHTNEIWCLTVRVLPIKGHISNRDIHNKEIGQPLANLKWTQPVRYMYASKNLKQKNT